MFLRDILLLYPLVFRPAEWEMKNLPDGRLVFFPPERLPMYKTELSQNI